MLRSVLVVLMILGSVLAEGRECVAPADETERLLCLQAAANCATIPLASERLTCFDAVFASENETTQAVPADDVSTLDGDTGSTDASVSSVAEIRPHRATQEVEESADDFIEASIIEVTENRNDISYLFLDNGQVWRETEKTRFRFEAGQSIRIESGIFGSRNLTVNGGKRIIKVRRVQ